MGYKYSIKENEHMAKASGVMLPISRKKAVEICAFIKGKKLDYAKKVLEDVIKMKKAVPFKRFTEGAGHKHGIGPGRYPIKACKEILTLLNSVESNAQEKSLDTSNLFIRHICVKQGPRTWRYGRQARVSMKRNHIEVVVEEREKEQPKKTEKKQTKKENPQKKEQTQKKDSKKEGKK